MTNTVPSPTGAFAGRRAVVSGGAGAIGGAICARLAEAGAVVWSIDREAAAGTVRHIAADVRDRTALTAAAARIESDGGPIDVLINAHGLQIRKSAMECTDADLAEIFDVNLAGAWRLCQVFAGGLRSRRGSIVNIASINGILAAKTGAAYGVSKAALIHFTRVLALELAPDVRVNAIAPTVVRSAMTADLFANPEYERAKIAAIPLGRIPSADDIAASAVAMASDAMGFVTGQVLSVDGGISLP
jgi:NAD(P)-dependent dehydrogenase (short-subunit alcohol dehydrogenase family)